MSRSIRRDVIVLGAGPAVGRRGPGPQGGAHRGGRRVAPGRGRVQLSTPAPQQGAAAPGARTRASQRVEGSVGAHPDRDGVLHRRDQWINDLSDSGAGAGWSTSASTWCARVRPDRRRAARRGRRHNAGGAARRRPRDRDSPLVPDIPGLAEARPWTNREATTSSKVPDRLAVLGGGVVACEPRPGLCGSRLRGHDHRAGGPAARARRAVRGRGGRRQPAP